MITNDYWFPFISPEDEKLPLRVYTVGVDAFNTKISQDGRTKIYREKGIMHHHVNITRAGKGIVTLNGVKKEADYGTVIYHVPYTPHIYESTDSGWQTYWITYAKSPGIELMDIESGVYPVKDIDNILSIAQEMFDTPRDQNFIKNTSAILYKLLIYLNNSITIGNDDHSSEILSPAIDYINIHYLDAIELKTLADLCYITPEYFCRQFMKHYHMRPFEYIRHLRIQDSKSKIEQFPLMPISEIGRSVGYENSSYFIEIFKKEVGVTPHIYKTMNKDKSEKHVQIF